LATLGLATVRRCACLPFRARVVIHAAGRAGVRGALAGAADRLADVEFALGFALAIGLAGLRGIHAGAAADGGARGCAGKAFLLAVHLRAALAFLEAAPGAALVRRASSAALACGAAALACGAAALACGAAGAARGAAAGAGRNGGRQEEQGECCEGRE
jgi:hypothetical protein